MSEEIGAELPPTVTTMRGSVSRVAGCSMCGGSFATEFGIGLMQDVTINGVKRSRVCCGCAGELTESFSIPCAYRMKTGEMITNEPAFKRPPPPRVFVADDGSVWIERVR